MAGFIGLATGLGRIGAGIGAARREASDANQKDAERQAAMQREIEQQAFQNWIQRQTLERQAAMDKRLMESDAYNRQRDTMGDTRQREQDILRAQGDGYTDATPDVVNAGVNAATAALGMGRGGMNMGTSPFRTKVGGVEVAAENAGGPRFATVGGKLMRYDPQQGANAAARKRAEEAAMRYQERMDYARQQAADRRAMLEATTAARGEQRKQLKAPTEEKKKNYLYYGLMKDSGEQLDALTPKIDAKKVTGYLTSRFFKPTLSPDEQMYIRAARDFAAGVLRKESGAAVTDDELRNVFDRYIDAGLDAPETSAAKRDARNAYVRRMASISQSAGDYYRGAQDNQPPLDAYPGARYSAQPQRTYRPHNPYAPRPQ